MSLQKKETKRKRKPLPNQLAPETVELIYSMAAAGKRNSDIARALKTTHSTVYRYLKKKLLEGEGGVDRSITTQIKKSELSVLQSKCAMLLDGLTTEKVAKSPINTLAVAYGILFDKRRLISGKSTQNSSISAIIKMAHGLKVNGAELKVRVNAIGEEE